MRNLLARIRKLLGLGPKAQRPTERLLVTVPEFTLSLETPEGTTTDEDVMGRFDEAMRASEEVSGSTAILDHGAGTISSTFQVKAPTLEVAQMIATRVFADALRSAGLSGDSLWRIVGADEEPEWPRSDLQAQRRSEAFKAVRTQITGSRVPASGQVPGQQGARLAERAPCLFEVTGFRPPAAEARFGRDRQGAGFVPRRSPSPVLQDSARYWWRGVRRDLLAARGL